jgi:tetratricopeptide (TPR) repeat protein
VLALGTSAEIYLLKQDVARAIEEAQKSLRVSETIPDLKDYYEAHYTLYSAYASMGKNARAAEHLQKYLEQYGSRLVPGDRKAYEGEVKRLKGLK